MSINGVITPFFWLHFWLHNGYTILDCVTFFFLGNKKPFLSRVSICVENFEVATEKIFTATSEDKRRALRP